MDNNWTYVDKGLPRQLEEVLFVTRKGQVHKGFCNLRNAWIMQNCDGLVARLMPEGSVHAWAPLPDVDDIRWRTSPQPETGSYVLTKDRVDGMIVITYVTENRWIIRNTPDDDITFWMHDGSAWMPLPELWRTEDGK